MAATPVKTNEVGCFICCTTNSRYYNISNKKSTSSGFIEKLRLLFNDDNLFSSLSNVQSASVCRNCFRRVETVTEFIVQLRTSAVKYVAGGSVRLKRGAALSPATPEGLYPVDRPVAGCRKQLRLESPNTAPGEIQPANDELTSSVLNEHGYCTSMIQKQSDENSLLDKIKSVVHCDQKFDSCKHQLQELRSQSASLTSRTAMFSSVLHKCREITKLQENADHLLDDIVEEMIERVPFLLKVMLCVAVPANEHVKESLLPVLASAYSLLMKHKYDNLSAYHRLTSVIAIRGGLDERAQTRFNHLGLMLCWSSRVTIQESIQTVSDKQIAELLKQNPLVKVTGDNLDIYVKTSNLSKERRHKDLHLFTSNIIFSRVAKIDMCNNSPQTDVTQLNCENVIMSADEKTKFLEAYSVLLARILCKIPAFQQYKKLLPEHLPHEYSQKMSNKSVVYPLPIMMKNESKHEDCLAIMDSYEDQLINLYTKAFGNGNILRRYGVPLGGDQLTRVRLQEAKSLRTLSVTPEKRFDDLHPIVCEMWHTKQDFLEKCYKKLFKAEHSPGTLNHFKTILHRTDVNGKVKGRFQSHFDLLMLVGECMVAEQFLEYLGMESKESQPKHPKALGIAEKPQDEQKVHLLNFIKEFMGHYGYGKVDHPEALKTATSDKPSNLSLVKPDGQKIQIQTFSTRKHEPDELYNYSLQLCHWYLQLNELHDTAKEGDLNRTILNCQYSMPFFYSHSKLSKYLVENIDYVLKCNFLSSPLQRIRILEGSYVNIKGGKGQNVESDLTQEHSVCNQKALIKSLGANKSENAIKRVTGSADTIAEICSKFDESVQIKPKCGRHSKPLNDSDKDLISKTLRKIRPFHFTPGRKCPGFTGIDSMPVNVEQMMAMKERLNQIISRLTRGLNVAVDHVDSDSSDDDLM